MKTWAFIHLSQAISSICNHRNIDFSQLIKPTSDGYSIQIRKGEKIVVNGLIEHFNRRICIELYYNKLFSTENTSNIEGSWSKNMQPDYWG